MMWYPAEVSGLRRAGQQASGETISSINTRNKLKVTKASELLGNTANSTINCTFQTPCTALNEILKDVIVPGLVSLAAENSTHRTTLSYYIAASFLMETEKSVTIIDTTGCFDATKLLRVLQVLTSDGMSSFAKFSQTITSQTDAENNEQPSIQNLAMLDRVQVCRVFDFEGLKQTVSELKLRSAAGSISGRAGAIFIDDVSSVVGLEIAKDNVYGFAQLEGLTLDMRSIADGQRTVFLLLNTTTRNAEIYESNGQVNRELVPSLGRNFADLLDCSLILLSAQHYPRPTRAGSKYLKVVRDVFGVREQHVASFEIRSDWKIEMDI